MEYKELSKLYYINVSSARNSDIQKELMRRKSMDSTYDLGIHTRYGDLFVAMPREVPILIEKILRTEQESFALMQGLPSIARAAVVRGLVLDEVVSTNAIENINSTRRQVEDALESLRGNDNLRRFRELARLYLNLSNSSEIPRTPEDIREIYDLVMKEELGNKKAPDGLLFRKDGVDITAGGTKVIHRGVEPEKEITRYIERMLELISRDDMPEIISAIAAHYIFEYVHPFYDGNGRTGRYLLSLFLRKTLSVPTVLSLSRAIAENKTLYYSAFSSAEKPLNYGELTFFVCSMLELIRIAQVGTMDRLKDSSVKFSTVQSSCKTFFETYRLQDKECELLFVLAQFDLFGMVPSLTWDELASHISLSKQMTRKHLTRLTNKGLIKKVSNRPLRFALSAEAERGLGIVGE